MRPKPVCSRGQGCIVGPTVRWRLGRSINSRQALRAAVPKTALRTRFRSSTVGEIARHALQISRLGLKNRGRINAKNQDETLYLAPLDVISGNQRTVSDLLLARYNGDWHGKIDHIFEEFAF